MSDALDYVNSMLDNEDTAVSRNVKKQKKSKEKVKKVPRKVHVYTEQELIDSGWNPELDSRKVEEFNEGSLYKLSKKQEEYARLPRDTALHLVKKASLYNKACVYAPPFSIYGWGVDFEEAIKNCLRNCKEWSTSHPERVEATLNIWRKNILKIKETSDKTVTDILNIELR